MTVSGGVGRYVSWDGGCLFIGEKVGLVPVHSHQAIQIVFGSEPGVRLKPNEGTPWTAYDGATIASRQPHAMDASMMRVNAVLFVEPETAEGRALAERHREHGIVPFPAGGREAGAPVIAAWDARDVTAMATAARGLVSFLTNGVEPRVVTDERILRAIRYINLHLTRQLTLDEVAAEACLSPSRFRHLFVEQLGMGLRPYVLWRRFLRVWQLLDGGASLSAAAHGAGFADASHLTRTCRRMFGFPPSLMVVGLHHR